MKIQCGVRPLVAKTCKSCGALKLASEFPKFRHTSNGVFYYHSNCKKCGIKKASKSVKRANALSIDEAEQARSEWSPSDRDTLARLTAAGASAAETAKALGRSINAIYMARHRMRYDL